VKKIGYKNKTKKTARSLSELRSLVNFYGLEVQNVCDINA